MLAGLRLFLLGLALVRGAGKWWDDWKAVRGIDLVDRGVFSLRGTAAWRIVNDPKAMGINAVAAAAAAEA
jgi:hypothetical protein